MKTRRVVALLFLAVALFLVACGDDDEPSSNKPAATATAKADACAKDRLKTLAPGKLTVATDKPAFPP